MLFLSFLSLYVYFASAVPDRFEIDGYLNYGATQYLAKHKRLPVVAADNKELVFSQIGATRSLRPPLTYISNATTHVWLGAVLKDRKWSMRIGSALLGASIVVLTFMSALMLGSGTQIAVLAALLLGLMPRFGILASTNNDDIGAIFSVALLSFCALLLRKYETDVRALAGFFAAIGVVLLTKFTAWLVLPWVITAVTPILRRQRKQLLDRLPVFVPVLIVSGAWWPLFNMFHYGLGDPTALNYAASLQIELIGELQNRSGYWTRGISLLDLLRNQDNFLVNTFASSVGYLPWISMSVSWGLYFVYAVCALLAAITLGCLLYRSSRLLASSLTLMFLSQFGFYLHHNLLRDIQVDGRYLLPLIVPMILLVTVALATFFRESTLNRQNAEKWVVIGFGSGLIGLALHNGVVYWIPNGLTWFAG